MDFLITILWLCSITSAGTAKGNAIHELKNRRIFHIFHKTLFGAVSFFGDSHVAMPLQEAKLATYLRLKFRTRQSNGILFLAAGRTDYCLLSIDDGRVKLNLKISDHLTEVSGHACQYMQAVVVFGWSFSFIRF